MVIRDSGACNGCALAANLNQCGVCSRRLNNSGFKVAACNACKADEDKMSLLGEFLQRAPAGGGPEVETFVCNFCLKFERQERDSALTTAVAGPSPQQVLRTLATHTPWFLDLQRATPQQKLEGLIQIKRRIDSSGGDLAEHIAANDPIAALAYQSYNSNPTDPRAKTTMNAIVMKHAPHFKYKDLLLPLSGSLARARQHFGDLMAMDNTVVKALAAERDYLCVFFERQLVPPRKRGGRNTAMLEPPLHMSVALRFVFKQLSIRIKKESARDETQLMLM